MAPATPDVPPSTFAASATLPSCEQCGSLVVRRRRSAQQNEALCLSCDQRARRSAYFRSYYESNKDRILRKNRRWAKDNKDKLVQLRQARQTRQMGLGDEPRKCSDCGVSLLRATRCRKCYIRFRYATDPEYRERRLATTRRWLGRRQVPIAPHGRRDTILVANAS